MECKRIRDEAGLADLRGEWEALWEVSQSPLLPLSWSWFDAWWRSFANELGPSSELNILAFRAAGELRAILPLFRHQTRFRGISIRELASVANDYSPLWDAILAANVTQEELDAVGRGLMREPDVDVFALRMIAGESPLRRWIIEHSKECGAWGDRHSFKTPLVDTTHAWDEYFSSRARKYRNKLKKKLRDFDSHEGTAISFVALDRGDHPALEEIVEVSKRSWKRTVGSDLGSRPSQREFLRRLIDHIGPTNDAGVWFARLDDRPIACELHVRSNGTTYPIRADMDEAARRLSPGSVAEHYALKAAFEDPQIRVYDTCADNYWYLRNLTEDVRMIHHMEVFPRRVKPAVLHQLEYRAMPLLRRVRRRLQKAEELQ